MANEEDLTLINNASSLPHATMGAAIPWRYYCKEFGGRAALLQAIHNAWVLGNSSEKVRAGPTGSSNLSIWVEFILHHRILGLPSILPCLPPSPPAGLL